MTSSLFPCLVTGAAGFIGSHLYRHLSAQGTSWAIDNFSHPSYPHILQSFTPEAQAHFVRMDVGDVHQMKQKLDDIHPQVIFHLAAQTHVDRAIDAPQQCVDDNIQSTLGLLQAVRDYFFRLPEKEKSQFRLMLMSTDEVYGSASARQKPFDEQSPPKAGNPYSASKVACEQLALAWKNTYRIPILIARCSNNFGAWQHAEKLIPRTILRACSGLPIEVYGDGSQVRDWLYVEDQVRALIALVKRGRVGEIYNISGSQPLPNIALIQHICQILNESHCAVDGDLIHFVADRPGHDVRYAIDDIRFRQQTAWQPTHDFQAALRETVLWYVQAQSHQGEYQPILARQGIL